MNIYILHLIIIIIAMLLLNNNDEKFIIICYCSESVFHKNENRVPCLSCFTLSIHLKKYSKNFSNLVVRFHVGSNASSTWRFALKSYLSTLMLAVKPLVPTYKRQASHFHQTTKALFWFQDNPSHASSPTSTPFQWTSRRKKLSWWSFSVSYDGNFTRLCVLWV